MPYNHQALIELAQKIELAESKTSYDSNLTPAPPLGALNRAACLTHYFHAPSSPFTASYKAVAVQTQAEWHEVLLQKAMQNWMKRKGITPTFLPAAASEFPFAGKGEGSFTFIDLFAGMGGFRLAMEAWGGSCVFSSEWNPYARRTYYANFGDIPFGDITTREVQDMIPRGFDVLCAGFPCQPFSIAGVSKKKSLGRATGFLDEAQGTLFFEVAKILRDHRPKAFFLENVKNLTSHDKGNTFRVICETLESLDYSIHFKVMDAQNYVPQHRERIMIVGFDKHRYQGKEAFHFPPSPQSSPQLKDILLEKVDEKYILTEKLWQYLQMYAQKHQAKGNGFGFGLTSPEGVARTLSARYYKDGSEILIQRKEGNPRRLTPRECARLMGYPDTYRLGAVSDVQAYRQCGNSVVVPLITAVAEQLIQTMTSK